MDWCGQPAGDPGTVRGLLLENRTQYVTLATAQTRNETLQGELARSAERLEHAEQARREVSERHAADQAVLSAQLEAQRAARISQEQRARLSCTMVSIPLRPIAAHSRQTFFISCRVGFRGVLKSTVSSRIPSFNIWKDLFSARSLRTSSRWNNDWQR